MLSHREPAAGHRAWPAAARLDGPVRRAPSLSLPAADHGQHHGVGHHLPGRLLDDPGTAGRTRSASSSSPTTRIRASPTS
ncbi:hypothetical protein ACRAWD_26275 [Caulobacter segnis]